MVYRVIGTMSGSSLDGLDIVFAELEETGGKWNYTINNAATYAYNNEWQLRLAGASALNAYDYLRLHGDYGKYTATVINQFIDEYHLHHRIQLIASHGHTVFHAPQQGFTSQLGCGATIAASTGINVVSDLRAIDIALGGQGAPIVPVGEKLLFSEYDLLLNIGGIANISFKKNNGYTAFDICPANRILNLLASSQGKAFDEDGNMASVGTINADLLQQLNELDYYKKQAPKSLANSFGVEVILPIIESYDLPVYDALRTYVAHISKQVVDAVQQLSFIANETTPVQLLVTGGGAFNQFLVNELRLQLAPLHVNVVLPSAEIINYKEALIMALLGILRWREENTTLASVTGATRDSIGGAVWMGQEA